jgi:hypothetical protein
MSDLYDTMPQAPESRDEPDEELGGWVIQQPEEPQDMRGCFMADDIDF